MTGLSEEPKKLWERRTELRRLKCLSKRSWRPRNIASSLNGTVEKRGLVTLTAANLAILDTSVYVDNLRSGRFKQEILDLKFVIRCSAVVLAELSRGARSREMKRFVDDLAKNLRIIAPNEREWVQSGRIVNRLVVSKGYGIHKTREIHFDVLIALTARRIGAYLITCNIDDFTAVREFFDFNLVCW